MRARKNVNVELDNKKLTGQKDPAPAQNNRTPQWSYIMGL